MTEADDVRLFLAGRVALVGPGGLIDERRFPGRQGRVMFARLAIERDRAVPREQLAEALWGERPPRAWEPGLRAIASKLRVLLHAAGVPGSETLSSALGCYQLTLPAGAWVDLEAAADALHRAETALRAGDPSAACGWALGARAIASRSLLPGEDGRWLDRERTKLADLRLRALDCLAEVWIAQGDPRLAVRDAEEAISLEPFRESSHRLLMRAHQAAGNRAAALLAYERCRKLLAEELGADPAPETALVFEEILRA